MSAVQELAGWPLYIKEAGRYQQLLELRTYSPKVLYISPRPAVSPRKNKRQKNTATGV